MKKRKSDILPVPPPPFLANVPKYTFFEGIPYQNMCAIPLLVTPPPLNCCFTVADVKGMKGQPVLKASRPTRTVK